MRFRVTVPPGAPIPGVGFVHPGGTFEAPKGYVPSKTFEPLDEEAVEALAKLGVKATLPPPPPAAAKPDDTLTLQELSEGGKKKQRASDSK